MDFGPVAIAAGCSVFSAGATAAGMSYHFGRKVESFLPRSDHEDHIADATKQREYYNERLHAIDLAMAHKMSIEAGNRIEENMRTAMQSLQTAIQQTLQAYVGKDTLTGKIETVIVGVHALKERIERVERAVESRNNTTGFGGAK